MQHPSIDLLKYPKNGLKFTGKSKSVENEMARPGEYSSSTPTQPLQKSVEKIDQRVYSIKITRTASTKDLEPRMTTKAAQNPPEKKTRRKIVGTRKANSLDHTPPDPDVTAVVMVKCLSQAVFSVVKLNDADRGTHVDVFVEATSGFPSFETVHTFFEKIFTSKGLSAECAVTAAAYVDRLDIVSNLKINQTNWRRVCFISILEADKVLRDKLVWNEDYKDLIPDIDLFDLRKLERAFLKYIEFNLTLSQSDYAKYYFDLLSLRESTTEGVPQLLSASREGTSWLTSPRGASKEKKV